MNNYTPHHGDGKAAPTPTPQEALIGAVHGVNAHDLIIPMLKKGMSHSRIAAALSSPKHDLTVSASWVTWFVNRHYRKVSRWERVS